MLHVYYTNIRSSMSSSSCAHRLLLTKEALRNYKYALIITRFALQIRDILCDDIEKGMQSDKQTNYAYKVDEHGPIYKLAKQINTRNMILIDVISELQKLFPDSKINIFEKEIMNGFVVTKNTYIEIDWS